MNISFRLRNQITRIKSLFSTNSLNFIVISHPTWWQKLDFCHLRALPFLGAELPLCFPGWGLCTEHCGVLSPTLPWCLQTCPIPPGLWWKVLMAAVCSLSWVPALCAPAIRPPQITQAYDTLRPSHIPGFSPECRCKPLFSDSLHRCRHPIIPLQDWALKQGQECPVSKPSSFSLWLAYFLTLQPRP